MSPYPARVSHSEPAIAHFVAAQEVRRAGTRNFLAAEQYTRPKVLVTKSFPGRRHCAGQQHYEAIEHLAIEANVQPL